MGILEGNHGLQHVGWQTISQTQKIADRIWTQSSLLRNCLASSCGRSPVESSRPGAWTGCSSLYYFVDELEELLYHAMKSNVRSPGLPADFLTATRQVRRFELYM